VKGLNSSEPVGVCVLSFHPLVFPTIRSLVPDGQFLLQNCAVPSDRPQDLQVFKIPVASLYVVEAHDRRAPTESLIGRVQARNPRARVVVVAQVIDERTAFPLLRLGVKGLITYTDLPVQFARALSAVAGGGFWIPRYILSQFVESVTSRSSARRLTSETVRLTRREREVLIELLGHLSNKEIAEKLGLTERTVKFHVSHLLLKHDVKRRADLILLFLTSR
jgi:DNA-binding NarL/FixJ family response regulator